MKKYLLLALLLVNLHTLQAQEIFLHSGKNLTTYDYKDSNHPIVNLQNGIGFNYEAGFFSAGKSYNPVFFSLSGTINVYNATGYTTGAAMEWKTNYVGVKGALYFNVIKSNYNNLALKVGLGTESIVFGRQKINFDQMDLVSQKEFAGIFAGPGVGLLYSYSINDDFGIQLVYNYDKHFSINQRQENLNFKNHSLNIGFSIQID